MQSCSWLYCMHKGVLLFCWLPLLAISKVISLVICLCRWSNTTEKAVTTKSNEVINQLDIISEKSSIKDVKDDNTEVEEEKLIRSMLMKPLIWKMWMKSDYKPITLYTYTLDYKLAICCISIGKQFNFTFLLL